MVFLHISFRYCAHTKESLISTLNKRKSYNFLINFFWVTDPIDVNCDFFAPPHKKGRSFHFKKAQFIIVNFFLEKLFSFIKQE